jgi:hypothetical protein
MALQGPAYVRGVLLPEAFIQLFDIASMPPFGSQGMGNIYTNREQALEGLDNSLEGFVVMSIRKPNISDVDGLYNEILAQSRFVNMVRVDDVDLIPIGSLHFNKYVLGLPDGYVEPTPPAQ